MPSQPNQVPQLPNLRQQFAQRRHQPMPPPLGQSFGQQPQPHPEHQIQQQVHELALEIYARLAVDAIAGMLDRPDGARLRQLAADAQAAAKAYYESIGVQFHEGES